MKPDSLDQYEVPRDPELAEAFEAFIQQTHVPRDFHARVRARVQQRRSHHGHWGWSKRWWTWWTHDWSPLGVWAATVCALLSLACNLGLGYYTWRHCSFPLCIMRLFSRWTPLGKGYVVL